MEPVLDTFESETFPELDPVSGGKDLGEKCFESRVRGRGPEGVEDEEEESGGEFEV